MGGEGEPEVGGILVLVEETERIGKPGWGIADMTADGGRGVIVSAHRAWRMRTGGVLGSYLLVLTKIKAPLQIESWLS